MRLSGTVQAGCTLPLQGLTVTFQAGCTAPLHEALMYRPGGVHKAAPGGSQVLSGVAILVVPCSLVFIKRGYVQRRIQRHATPLKVHKRENFLGFDFEICTFS